MGGLRRLTASSCTYSVHVHRASGAPQMQAKIEALTGRVIRLEAQLELMVEGALIRRLKSS
ncbi:MAG: hypothetical protein E6H66_24125 [Betaproteobacteria bacterium]|nr:MAG: hypothetical protein E6H66_24125 [Betaproteobacteria bacterium]